mmetsp:Transcript_34783/g.61232  ORF Transcript_34783/g.61232 Transcript_34783/m.61232 type:complete len:82 (+) Transcript_34783:1157-1402(+)
MVLPHIIGAAGLLWIGYLVRDYMNSTDTLTSNELRNFMKTMSFEHQEELRKKRVTIPEAELRKIDPLYSSMKTTPEGEADI